MRTKIFLAFVVVIVCALLSNLLFQQLIVRDFDSYVNEIQRDQFKWIVSSVEETYSEGQWDRKALSEAVHWAMMLGLHVEVVDSLGREIISSHDVMDALSETMRHRMEGLYHIAQVAEPSEEYPLHVKGERVGSLLYHHFNKGEIKDKEAAFKERVSHFLLVTLLITGFSLIAMALLFSQSLSKPINKLRDAAEKVARGDFNVRTTTTSKDEIGELGKAFNYMAASLQKEEEVRRHLMSNVAHELRTPLTIMKTHVEAMADGVIENRDKGIEIIKEETERLIKLVKGIEDIAAAEASFLTKVEQVEINLGGLLSGLVDEMLPSFRAKMLSLELRRNSDVTVVIDADKLDKIVRNLLSNALKFTDQGGVVIDYGSEDSSFFITVSDSGKGIAESDMPRIFTRFYRGEGSGTEGLGLGLAIVNELVSVMGGKVVVTSTVGAGSTFRVSFPQKPGLK